MKKNIFRIMLVVFVIAGVSPCPADLVTFTFDPNDLIDQFPSSVAAGFDKQGPDSRVIVGNPGDSSTVATTYTNPNGPYGVSPQPDGYSAYLNWKDSLGPNEGILAFNIWLRGDFPNVAAWGQQLKMAGDPAANNNLSGTAGGGWQVIVGQFSSPSLGYYIEWYAPDLASALRPGGLDLPAFSFTADLVVDPDVSGSGADLPVVSGNTYDVWFGASNSPGPVEDPFQNYAVIFDSNGWGTNPTSVGPFAAGDSTLWNGKLQIQAQAVPEPSSVALGFAGLLALGFALRSRRRSIAC